MDIFHFLTSEVTPAQVRAVLGLLQDGATIPFIARYRKEVTHGLDEVQIAEVAHANNKLQEFLHRRTYILDVLNEGGVLDKTLEGAILSCDNLHQLEDLYLPYKKKKKTRADLAREHGLEGLAKIIMAQNHSAIGQAARGFLNEHVDTVEDAIEGAGLIIADWINQDVRLRTTLRKLFLHKGVITSVVKRGKKTEGVKFKDFFKYSELIRKCPSYRLLALLRGEKEGFLNLTIRPDREEAMSKVLHNRIKPGSTTRDIIRNAAEDAYERLLAPSMETQARHFYKEKADQQAIEVFAQNVEQLLMAPPLGEKRVLAIDPGFRTGCKVVTLSDSGQLLHHTAIFPHPPQMDRTHSLKTLSHLIREDGIEAIAVGDGTAGRETFEWLSGEPSLAHVQTYLVNESGASIYSASEIARKELPDQDVTVRGAVSIGRRLMDPLAELIKIDPKSIGVGEYQHDVNPGQLNTMLKDVVERCVNKVGVQLNTASVSLLTYVAGLGETLARNIIQHRNKIRGFTHVYELLDVPRLGKKAFEQCSGFLRIRDGKNPLDNTGVHPESYPIVEAMALQCKTDVAVLMKNNGLLDKLDLGVFVTGDKGLPTLRDIVEELKRPGLDVRGHAEAVRFQEGVRTFEDVVENMVITGTIKNITGFGAFVDLGIKESGLIHISEISNRFLSHPSEALHLQQRVTTRVIGVDAERRRIQLSIKQL